eukprot:CAMPEP_0185018496 /NCGR_PEP_ID=MMETSP1103-20130426/1204_1 /TAXON_ID=36769 /ORGANISM="Paraphysomonas bandaiensis, Strain Caron Lab Isolate" /LENGTH=692 /DNA_ID=CAMNT_0027548333 /DNA_START=96 /DNA_END=2171 /DNA_ORIENTATION=-
MQSAFQRLLTRTVELDTDTSHGSLSEFFVSSDSTDVDIDRWNKAWSKVLKESKVFGRVDTDPSKFSSNLVKELATRYDELSTISTQASLLEINTPKDVSGRENDLSTSMTEYIKAKLAVKNMRESYRALCECRSKERSQRDLSYEERIMLIRKRLKNVKLVWGHKPHIAQVPFYPLDLKHHGQPSVKYGIADSKKKEPEDALVRIDGGIIGLWIPNSDISSQSLAWNAYSVLLDINSSSTPSRLFPLPLNVNRESPSAASPSGGVLFSFELPQVTHLRSITGISLALALRKNSQLLAMWVSQLGEAMRELHSRSVHMCLYTPSVEDLHIREDGSLVIGNLKIATRDDIPSRVSSSMKSQSKLKFMVDGDEFLRFVQDTLTECLDISREVSFHLAAPDTEYTGVISTGVNGTRGDITETDLPERLRGVSCATIGVSVAEECILRLNLLGVPGYDFKKKDNVSVTVKVVSNESSKHSGGRHIGEDDDCKEGDIKISYEESESKIVSVSVLPPTSHRTQKHGLRIQVHGVCAGVAHILLSSYEKCVGVENEVDPQLRKNTLHEVPFALLRVLVVPYPVCGTVAGEELVALADRAQEWCIPFEQIQDEAGRRVVGAQMLLESPGSVDPAVVKRQWENVRELVLEENPSLDHMLRSFKKSQRQDSGVDTLHSLLKNDLYDDIGGVRKTKGKSDTRAW